MNWSFGMLKPDGISRVKEIFTIIESVGLRIVLKKEILLTEQQVRQLYRRHIGKKFFQSMVDFLRSGKAIVFVVSGEDALNRLNKIIGDTNPQEAQEGTIRREFGTSVQNNAAHSSYSALELQDEVNIFFNKEELAKLQRL